MFTSVKQLYLIPKKVAAIEEIILKHLESLKKANTFSDAHEEELDPTVLLWLLLFSAQHFDMKNDFKQALALIDEAIEHTPTLVEAYTVRARILKHQGDFAQAAESYNKGRELDQADRYLNARCSKYLIRAGKIEEAEKMMALFAKEVDGKLNVHEMQCMWYEIELGAAYKKQGQLAKSLKMYKYIEQHFNTFYDDQFDFHYFALRKGNINAYINMILWEDKLYAHKYFLQGAIGLIKCYLGIAEIMKVEKKTKEEEAIIQECEVILLVYVNLD